ncbi:multidrug efflux SMR transporter [Halomonas sp. Y3S6]|uniref:Multidrug efflux SMR transporter n=2 Tax=Billgrantia antri TaxID=2846777 RepID=A0ABS6ZTS0_9GAMM|nr:multidrug efflux SMR transporter [Halomonas antri]MBW6393233.1 multidrug efflux SMR transporter [Halomonas antri]
MAFVYLALAIVAEVVATSALKATDGFTRPGPSLLVVVGYALAFFMLSLVLRTIPVGIAYAIWAGLGIVLVALVGVLVYGQRPDTPAVVGIGLIITGVVVIQLFSRLSTH